MTSRTFPGFVSTGRLQFQGSLAPFEGRQVLVTVIAPDPPFVSSAPQAAAADEPPVDLDVETEVFAPVPPTVDQLGPVVVRDSGPASPCVILPEDATDV